MSSRRKRLLLQVVQTDRTFQLRASRGQWLWVGKCIHCNRKLSVERNGDAGPNVTLEHILPRHHGGGEEPGNLAIACGGCNHSKGLRHDHQRLDDPGLQSLLATLQERRKKRWRERSEPSA